MAALPLAGQVLKDPGGITCVEWTSVRATSKQDPFSPWVQGVTAWAQGYLTGALDLSLSVAGDVPAERQTALTRGNTTVEHLTDADRIPAGIDAYCAAHHDETVGSMFLGLMRQAYGW